MLNEKECKKALEILQEKYLNFDVVDELICFKRLIKEHFNPQPYKFEGLKPDMWVWDDGRKRFIKIAKIGKKVIYVADEIEELDCYCVFEENRFFPVTKALEYQK